MYKTAGKCIKQWGNVKTVGKCIKQQGNLTSTNVIRVLGVGNCQEVIAFHDFSQGRG